MATLIGQQLGQYRITALLGEGGMAAVYRAERLTLKSEVAVKVIKPGLITPEKMGEFTRRFEREAETIAKLSHPHILKLFDYGHQDDLLYLVMELLPGGSLADLIKQKPLDLPYAAHLLDQIGDALDYAHSKGIIHRDLKPQNVLLDERGNTILTDFGIAKLLNDTTTLTHTGVAMGTPFYMSPEQCQGGAIDARSDLYALGVMLFEMLTRDVPFKSDTPISLLYMHINQPPPSVRKSRPDIPESVERVIHKAMAKQPAARFQNAGEFIAAFRTAITGAIPPGLEEAEPPGERTAPTPFAAIPTPGTTASLEEPKTQSTPRGRGILGALVTVVGMLFILFSLTQGGGEVNPTVTPSATMPEIAANPTETLTPSVTETLLPTATFTDTLIPTALPTLTFTATFTDTPTLTPTDAPPPKVTSTPSLTPSETLDPIRAAETIFFSGLTQTATQWTPTPTPNLTETVSAYLTAIAVASFTRTPLPSDTPTFTLTPTATYTSTQTFTATASATHTHTLTPTATITWTLTPTLISSPAPTLIPAGASNTVWMPVSQDFNGVTMVLVPAGCFMMGTPVDQVAALNSQYGTDMFNNQVPVHEVCFNAPFWIDKFEVTQIQFRQLNGSSANMPAFTGDYRPVEEISWIEARNFCAQRGVRLPTEAEWEYAARGPESLIYPWGNMFMASNVVYEENSGSQTANVGSRPGGVSWVGALDMNGNVWEWVNSMYRPYPYGVADGRENTADTQSSRVRRGGSWFGSKDVIRAALRYEGETDFRSSNGGFRCARPYQ